MIVTDDVWKQNIHHCLFLILVAEANVFLTSAKESSFKNITMWNQFISSEREQPVILQDPESKQKVRFLICPMLLISSSKGRISMNKRRKKCILSCSEGSRIPFLSVMPWKETRWSKRGPSYTLQLAHNCLPMTKHWAKWINLHTVKEKKSFCWENQVVSSS